MHCVTLKPTAPFHGVSIMKGSAMSGTEIAAFGKNTGRRKPAPPLSGKPLAGAPMLNMPALVRWLGLAFPASTAKQVAHVSGVPASTVDKWLRGECKPSGEALAALIAVFGPSFVAACMPCATWAREVHGEREELRAYRTIFKAAQGSAAQTKAAFNA